MNGYKRWAVAALAACLLLACKESGGPEDQPLCVQRGPAFHLLVRAPHGRLPRDTEIQVTYQGNRHEQYRLGHQSMNEDLCCQALASIPERMTATSCGNDAGLPPFAPAMAIACDVWSNGAAQVTLSASGYDTVVHELTATLDDECETIETSDVTVTLQRGDAGI